VLTLDTIGHMLSIDERFCGPATSGNGGYTSGLFAEHVPAGEGVVEVTLRMPPPLDRGLTIEQRGADTVLLDGQALVAEARRVDDALGSPDPVSFLDAERATLAYPWAADHPWPECFVCGTNRAEGDGLRIFPGAVGGTTLAAAPWRPDDTVVDDGGLVRPEMMWAALDCPSWFGLACFESWEGRPLLGRLAVEILRRPSANDSLVCVGWLDARNGRKSLTGSALFSETGELLGRARATWITVP
jgi:hypothetical protein